MTETDEICLSAYVLFIDMARFGIEVFRDLVNSV